MVKAAVARRYAKALLALVEETALDSVRTALEDLARAVEQSDDLAHVLASPAFANDAKTAVLTTLAQRAGAPPIVNRFLEQLIKTNRVAFLPDIAEAFAALADAQKGTRQVIVTAARSLPEADVARVRARLREILRQEVDVAFQTDPALVSGLQVRIGSMVYDSSVRTRFNAMRALLTKE
jgi:F-type H+-transporting ATPase subunit delta